MTSSSEKGSFGFEKIKEALAVVLSAISFGLMYLFSKGVRDGVNASFEGD
jgi:hypothetical protein